VVTKTIGIKTNIEHVALLKDMLIRLNMKTTGTPNHMKFIPMGLIHSIGAEAYTKLICKNNEFLNSITMIPIVGMMDETLELQIKAYNPTTNSTH